MSNKHKLEWICLCMFEWILSIWRKLYLMPSILNLLIFAAKMYL